MVTSPAYLEAQSALLTQQILHLGLILVGDELTESAFVANPALATIAEQTSLTRPNTTLPVGSYNATLGAWEMPPTAEFQFSNGPNPITISQCFVVKGGNAFAGNNDGTIVLLHTFPSPIALAPNQTVILKTPWSWQ